jgi:hypothetical protein
MIRWIALAKDDLARRADYHRDTLGKLLLQRRLKVLIESKIAQYVTDL